MNEHGHAQHIKEHKVILLEKHFYESYTIRVLLYVPSHLSVYGFDNKTTKIITKRNRCFDFKVFLNDIFR